MLVAGHEKYVKAFTQYGIRCIEIRRILPERNSLLGLRILIPPASFGIELASYSLRNQVGQKSICLQPIQDAALASAKGVVKVW
jgi:hypothetical protein